MKRIYLYIIGCALVGISACNKFLDMKPLTEVEDKNYYKSLNDITAAMAGIYGSFQETMIGTGANFSGYYHFWGEARSDNFDESQYRTNTETELTLNTLTSGNPTSNWLGLYKVIGRANSAIKYLPQTQHFDNRVTDVILNNSLAECYAMRAVCYFYIVRIWGDAVVWTEPYEDYTQNALRPRSPADSVLDHVIIPDLEKAYDMIQKNQKPVVWNIGEGAIAAILADVYLWKAGKSNSVTDYEHVKAWTQKVFAAKGAKGVVHGGQSVAALEPSASWKNLFIDPLTTNEAIWSIHWNYMMNGCACLVISQATSNNRLAMDSLIHADWKKNTSDIRVKWTYDTLTGLGHIDKIVKYYNVPGNSIPSGTGAPAANTYNTYLTMYRLGDVYLSYAEALNMTGDKDGAVRYLNFIRNRAGVPEIDINDPGIATPAMLQDTILQERRYELFAEGKRWFDLVRTNKVKEVMDPVIKRRQRSSGIEETGFGDDMRKVLWPIHRQRIEDNKAIKQNPAYE